MNEVITFGCRLNSYESEIIKGNLKKANTAGVLTEGVVVVHSCAVTNEAERQVKRQIGKLYRQNSQVKIIVAGCAAQLNPEIYSKMPGVIKVLGNADKLLLENYLSLDDHAEKIKVTDINQVTKLEHVEPIENFVDKARAFIEIQNGCNHSCTFCSITQARGNNRSLSVDAIIQQVRAFVANGYNEVVFTGVDITDFGVDLFGFPALGLMVKKVLRDVPELRRIRLSSIDVAEIDDQLFELIITDPRLMPHLHLSLQSGNNLILKRMKRRHNREQVLEFCQKVRFARTDVVFGADIIAGFPTETADMFQDTVDLLSEAGITYLHVFPYSSKKDTSAARMPQIALPIRKERAKRLQEIARNNLASLYKSMLNTKQKVVVEQNNVGRAENFAAIRLSGGDFSVKSVLDILVVDINDKGLIGAVI